MNNYKKLMKLITEITDIEYGINLINWELRISGAFDSKDVPDFGYLTPYAISNKNIQELYDFEYKNKYLNFILSIFIKEMI